MIYKITCKKFIDDSIKIIKIEKTSLKLKKVLKLGKGFAKSANWNH